VDNRAFGWKFSPGQGGAIGYAKLVRGCTFFRNVADPAGRGGTLGLGGAVYSGTLEDSIVWNCGPIPLAPGMTVNFSNVEGGWAGAGINNVNGDPRFASPATGDFTLTGGESIRLGPEWTLEVWHTPGHSYGHISLYDPRGHNLIIADATLYNAVLRADGQAAFPPTYRYVDTYLASMQRIAATKANFLFTSHYPVYQGANVAQFMAESRAFVDRVDENIIKALQTEHTLKDLTDLLSPDLGEWPAESNAYACFPLLGHLERLVLHGRVTTGRRDSLLTFKLK
jgi:glyoxylase-like metal-dependent hydrolase (beta-lactamase superfamily II)